MRPADLVLTPKGVRFRGRILPCTIGRGGLTTDKREGDGATPKGIHNIAGALYRPDRLACPVQGAVAIRPGDQWSDDVNDPDYNHMVRTPHRFSHEVMFRADPLYDLVLLTDWNWPVATPGLGSAIFIHRWRRPGFPTEGCIALAPADLLWIVRHISSDSRLIIR